MLEYFSIGFFSIAELTKAVKKCSIKSLEDLLSTELLNDMKISPTHEESSVGFDLQPKLTQAEASSLYVYKSAAGGNPVGNDYNGIDGRLNMTLLSL